MSCWILGNIGGGGGANFTQLFVYRFLWSKFSPKRFLIGSETMTLIPSEAFDGHMVRPHFFQGGGRREVHTDYFVRRMGYLFMIIVWMSYMTVSSSLSTTCRFSKRLFLDAYGLYKHSSRKSLPPDPSNMRHGPHIVFRFFFFEYYRLICSTRALEIIYQSDLYYVYLYYIITILSDAVM